MAARAYGRLMAGGGGDPFDRHLFACVIALTQAEGRPLGDSLGLSAEEMAALVGTFFPHAPELLAGLDPDSQCGEAQTVDESALRSLLLRHRAAGAIEERWLAHVIARRAQAPRLLWQELGLGGRPDLCLILAFHFTELAACNHDDMRWKPFFRRQIELAGGLDCRATVDCAECRRNIRCFGPESGSSLLLATHMT